MDEATRTAAEKSLPASPGATTSKLPEASESPRTKRQRFQAPRVVINLDSNESLGDETGKVPASEKSSDSVGTALYKPEKVDPDSADPNAVPVVSEPNEAPAVVLWMRSKQVSFKQMS